MIRVKRSNFNTVKTYTPDKMKYSVLSCLVVLSLLGFGEIKEANRSMAEPWSDSQLMAPADLAAMLVHPDANTPLVYAVGPGALIRNSIDMGPAHEKENLDKFKQALGKLPKDANIVIYCGCCPFEHCPNIRPAFSLMVEMKFTNA